MGIFKIIHKQYLTVLKISDQEFEYQVLFDAEPKIESQNAMYKRCLTIPDSVNDRSYKTEIRHRKLFLSYKNTTIKM